MIQFNEAGENAGYDFEDQPGIQNQPDQEKKPKNRGNKSGLEDDQTNPVTNSAEEISAGLDEEDLNDDPLKQTEEERDEIQNNARDAMNNDNYQAPADRQNDGKTD